jgi:hypothetical protein
VRCVVQVGKLAEKTEVKRSTSSPYWSSVGLAFGVESVSDEVRVTLVDAASKSSRAEPLGQITIKLIDLLSSQSNARHSRAAAAGGSGSDADGGGSHDAWHAVGGRGGERKGSLVNPHDVRSAVTSFGKGTLAALKINGMPPALERATDGSVASDAAPLAIRLSCDWKYGPAVGRQLTGGGALSPGGAASVDAVGVTAADDAASVLREARAVVDGMSSR